MSTSYFRPYLSWIEFYLIMTGLILIDLTQNIITLSNLATDLPMVMFIVGAVYYWKSIVPKEITFGVMADVAWITVLIISIYFCYSDIFSVIKFTCILAGLIIDFIQSYNMLYRDSQEF